MDVYVSMYPCIHVYVLIQKCICIVCFNTIRKDWTDYGLAVLRIGTEHFQNNQHAAESPRGSAGCHMLIDLKFCDSSDFGLPSDQAHQQDCRITD